MSDLEARRDRLRTYRASSLRVQRRFLRLGWVGAIAALGLLVAGASGAYVFGAVALTAIVSGSGWWITHAHIEDFDRQLGQLERGARHDRAA